MALSTERGRVVVFLVIMTGEAGVPGSDSPGMVRVTDQAIGLGVFSFPVLSAKSVVA